MTDDTEIDERASKGILISETRVPRRHRFVLRLSRRLWLPLSLSSRPSVTQQHLTSREKTESVVKSNGLPLLFLPRPNSQFAASPFPPRLRIKLQFCRQKSLKNGSSSSVDCRFRSGKASAFKMSWFYFPRFDYRISKSCLAKL